ncbi:MAG: GLPGLI family protein [Bacteroidales bacterium]|jgi:GLPGLI family protein|nr:GLPGLI family protein [Bacteroidales bacterium]MDY0370423.1 GLPGLI family protein [Bacteroidales bacterium]
MKSIATVMLIFCQLILINNHSRAQYVYLMDQGLTNFPVAPKSLEKFEVIDSSILIITYSVVIVNDTTNPSSLQNDILVLRIGEKLSKSYSNLLFHTDSIYTENLKRGLSKSPMFQGSVPPVEVFKNYPANKTTVIYRTFGEGPVLIYTEDSLKFDWKILPDTKKYLNYSCQKATTTFRGRTYEAWFTYEIPLSEGPYKFTGLPGLILQIQDTKNHYVFDCIGIEMEKNKDVIKMWDWEYEEISRKKLNAFIKRIHENPISYLKTSGITLLQKGKEGQVEPVSESHKSPYNPIELE